MTTSAYFNVRDFGANACAQPSVVHELTNLRYKWLRYPPGLRTTIYHPTPHAEYDSIGIQRAIDAAHTAGGGTVVVPAGDYLIAPFELKSRVRLHLEPGAHLWGSPHLEDYPTSGDFLSQLAVYPHMRKAAEACRLRMPLIHAFDAEDISITGHGLISGQSCQWIIPWMNAGPRDWNTIRRPLNVFHFFNCRRLHLSDVFIKDAPTWSVVIRRCEDVTIHGIRIHTFEMINADGIDLVETTNAIISDCRIHTTDDGICLKSFTPGFPVRNIVITNCLIRTQCNGVKIGTESVGDFEDITVSNIVVQNPDDDLKAADGGINICAVDGGRIRNVNISGLVTRNVHCPFYLVASNRARYQQHFREPRPGVMERIFISNVSSDGTRFTPFVVGTPSTPIRDIRLSNIHIRKTAEFCSAPSTSPVPACGEQYPNPFMFASPDGGVQEIGDGLPSHGLYLRHADSVGIRDYRVDTVEHDARPLFVQEKCTDIAPADIASLSPSSLLHQRLQDGPPVVLQKEMPARH